MNKPLLEVKDLKIYYPVRSGFFKQKKNYVICGTDLPLSTLTM